MAYTVQHLTSGKRYERPFVLANPYKTARSGSSETNKSLDRSSQNAGLVQAFHSTLPSYAATKLHSLPELAEELGVSHIFLKDEGTRFGLPAFKILGASWAIHRALCEELGLDSTKVNHEDVREVLEKSNKQIELVLCTEGNWGRACARYATLLDIKAVIFVPGFMSDYTRKLIQGEGADVRILSDGSYDDSIAAARKYAAENPAAMLILDTSFDDYTKIPQWVTDGYTTMLTEADAQIDKLFPGLKANTFFASVGVGSWAQAVVAYYGPTATSRIVTVEPIVAASFKESLHVDHLTPIKTGETIMAGMCCGTTSDNAWPVMRAGVDSAVAVTDIEAHKAVECLERHEIYAGPCGAATLAALRTWLSPSQLKLTFEERAKLVIVLFSTEGAREYSIPQS